MVTQCMNLYEKNVARGTLFVSIDNSKFLIKFYKSIKLELLLDEEITPVQNHVSISENNELDFQKNSDEFGRWGNYITLPELPSDQGIPQTSQQVMKAEDGESSAITSSQPAPTSNIIGSGPVDGGCSDTFAENLFDEIDNARKSGKRKFVNISEEEKESRQDEGTAVGVENANNFNFSSQNSQNSHDVNTLTVLTNRFVSPPKGDNIVVPEGLPKREIILGESDIDEVTITFGAKGTPAVHSCKDCFATFNTSQALRDHRKVKISNEYQCGDCSELFQYKAFLEVHKKSNHSSAGASLVYKGDQYWYSCDSCGTLVKTLIKLQFHNLVHTGEGIFRCCWCPQEFIEKSDLNQHIKSHKLSGMTRCRWCNKWCEDKGALAKHKLNCKVIKCHLCGTIFPNKTSRNQHYKDFHPNDILKCELCSYLFSSQEELQDHMEKHSKTKKMQCPLCGLFFSKLKKHMLVHKNPEEFAENEIYYCDKCPAKFTKQASFSRHRKGHLEDKPYQCPNCPRRFTNCGLLRGHIKRHKSYLPYTCEVCGNTCVSIDQLQSHNCK